MAAVEKQMESLFIKPQLVRRDSNMSSYDLRESKKTNCYFDNFNKSLNNLQGLDVSVPEFFRPKMARVKSTRNHERGKMHGTENSINQFNSPKSQIMNDVKKTRSEHALSAPIQRKPLQPLKALKPVKSNEPVLSELGPDSDPNNFTSMMIFQIPKERTRNESDEDVPDRLSQSLRSIRGSAKKKRMQKMMSTDMSQSFDGRRLLNGSTSPELLNGANTTNNQDISAGITEPTMNPPKIDISVSHVEDEYGYAFGNKSKIMPGISGAYYPGFEYEKSKTLRSTTRRPSTLPVPQASRGTPPTKQRISTHQLEPCQQNLTGEGLPPRSSVSTNNPGKQLQQAMEILPNFKAHWESLIDEINVVKNLAMYNREIILPKATEVTNMIISHCNNIRSKISGAAIEALKELYRFLKKALINNLEFAIKSLTIEAGKENAFLREKCERCFIEIIDSMISTSNNNHGIQKLICTFYATTKSKNQIQRTLTAQNIEAIITKLGVGRALSDIKDVTDKLILAMNSAFKDIHPSVRFYGKKMILFLNPHQDFNSLCRKYLSAEDALKIAGFQTRGDTTFDFSKPASARRSLSSSRVNSSNRVRSSKNPKSPPNTGPGRLMTTSLKEEIVLALRTPNSPAKLEALEKMKQYVANNGSLGSDVGNGVDLLCSMIKSAVPLNCQKSLQMAPIFIPLIISERILLNNLVSVLIDRVTAANTTLSEAQALSRAALTQINSEADPVTLLPIYAARISENQNGRPHVADFQIEISHSVKERKPQLVVRAGQKSLWILLRDRRCTIQAGKLGQLLYEMMGEDIYKEARQRNLETCLSVALNLRSN